MKTHLVRRRRGPPLSAGPVGVGGVLPGGVLLLGPLNVVTFGVLTILLFFGYATRALYIFDLFSTSSGTRIQKLNKPQIKIAL